MGRAAGVDGAVQALERRISPYEGAGEHDGLVIAVARLRPRPPYYGGTEKFHTNPQLSDG